jgi:PilZ domain
MNDKRKITRRRVLKVGKIVFADGMRVIDCTIRDMSKDGARLLLGTSIGVPDSFFLYEQSTGMLYPSSVIWRQPKTVGIKFDGEPSSIQDAANKRFSRLKFI